MIFVCAACQLGTPADPNDPSQVAVNGATVMRHNLIDASNRLNERRARGELDNVEYRKLIRAYAERLIDEHPLKHVAPEEAWEYGEVLVTAERWADAKPVLQRAVKEAKREHRRVNDSLRLARVLGELGEVDAAIATTRSIFDTRRRDAGPILPAVLFEIVPACEGKGHEVALAKLVKDSIVQHERVIVDPESEAGRAFLIARPVHIRNAWRKAVYLYQKAGQLDLAIEAARKADAADASHARI